MMHGKVRESTGLNAMPSIVGLCPTMRGEAKEKNGGKKND